MQVIISKECAAAVSQGHFGKLSSGKVVHVAASTDAVFCVFLNSAAAGQQVACIVQGEADVRVATVLTVGGSVKSDANGRAIADAAVSTHVVAGIALETGKAAVSSTYSTAKIILPVFKRPNA